MKSTEQPQRVMDAAKVTLTRYPERSRAVLSKAVFCEHKAIAKRLFNIKPLRRRKPDILSTIEMVEKAYFKPQFKDMTRVFQQQTVGFNAEATLEWIRKHPAPKDMQKNLEKFIVEEIGLRPPSDVNVHVKLESLLKQKPVNSWYETEGRIIVWQNYCVAAIFSPVFTEIKDRMKMCLNHKTIYADGMRPGDMSNRAKLVKNAFGFWENDLEKQDAQTDDNILNVEFELYAMLGTELNLLDLWRTVHGVWRFKGNFTKGERAMMRTTGQATTALGNVMTNMQIHARWVVENWDSIELMFFLGDDSLIIVNQPVDDEALAKDTATDFNMQSKPSFSTMVGKFCQLLCYKTENGACEFSCDWVRLRYRYEVTNGVSEASDELLACRTMSYCMMLGALPEVTDLIKQEQWPIQPEQWYSKPYAIAAMSSYYNCNAMEIETHYMSLLKMMTERVKYEVNFKVFTSKFMKH